MVEVSVQNALAPEHRLRCDALVDTGASHMVLPAAWRSRLGPLQDLGEGEFETATGASVRGSIRGPVQVTVAGFRPVFTDVVFQEMEPRSGEYDPLLGYVVLEMCQAAVDMVGHRLVAVKYLDLKRLEPGRAPIPRSPGDRVSPSPYFSESRSRPRRSIFS